MEQNLTTVHHALARAATEPKTRTETPMGTHTFRISSPLKEQAKAKCEAHGANFDEFLRKCCEGLILDYRP